jgi:hypothetical protein
MQSLDAIGRNHPQTKPNNFRTPASWSLKGKSARPFVFPPSGVHLGPEIALHRHREVEKLK